MKTKKTKVGKTGEGKTPSRHLVALKRFCRCALPGIFSNEAPQHLDHSGRNISPTIKIFASELQAIARTAAEQPTLETGGHLFGAWDSEGQPIVMVATPPGPNSVHTPVHFQQDLAYYNGASGYLASHYAAALVGRWHLHPPNLNTASEGDRASAKSIMEKLKLAVLVELIITIDSRRSLNHIHAYAYLAGDSIGPRSAKLALLPGLSPMREAAFGSAVFPDRAHYAWRYCLDSVVIDEAATESPVGDIRGIESQIDELPTCVQNGTKVATAGEAVSVDLPLSGGTHAFVGYSRDDLECPAAILLHDSGREKPEDVTREVNPKGSKLSLAEVHRRLQEIRFGGQSTVFGLPFSREHASVGSGIGVGIETRANEVAQHKVETPTQKTTCDLLPGRLSQPSVGIATRKTNK